MSEKMTNKELEDLLGQLKQQSFTPYFTTRTTARFERYRKFPLWESLVMNPGIIQRGVYTAAACLVILLSFSYFQEGTLSLDHLLGLGNFNEEDILNYINPVI